MLIVVPCFSFVTIDPTVDEFGEEEYFEDFEDNQGQATQGKPPLLVAYLDPIFLIMQVFPLCLFQRCIVFIIAITS
jgi:hypothetical protein